MLGICPQYPQEFEILLHCPTRDGGDHISGIRAEPILESEEGQTASTRAGDPCHMQRVVVCACCIAVVADPAQEYQTPSCSGLCQHFLSSGHIHHGPVRRELLRCKISCTGKAPVAVRFL